MPAVIDLVAQRFGRLVVTGSEGNRSIGASGRAIGYWSCRCDCGNVHSAAGTNLRSGKVQSCGCLKKDVASARMLRHGHSTTPNGRQQLTREYRTWRAMRDRCRRPKSHAFKYYGGRGIRVCDRWIDTFETFLADMGPCPDGHVIDRIDNDGDYTPENCRWVTPSENCNNKRDNALVRITETQLSRITGLSTRTIKHRLKAGETIEQMLMRHLKTQRSQATGQ